MQNTTPDNNIKSLDKQITQARFLFWGFLLAFLVSCLWNVTVYATLSEWLPKYATAIPLSLFFIGNIWMFYRDLLCRKEVKKPLEDEMALVSLETKSHETLINSTIKLAWASWFLLLGLHLWSFVVTHKWVPLLFNSLFWWWVVVFPLMKLSGTTKKSK